MPCYNGDDSYDRGYNSAASEIRQMQKTIEKFEAVLCGIMQVDPSIVDRIDWKEVGITKQQHLNWWKEHQLEDARRKKREAEEKVRKAQAEKLRKQKAAAERAERKEKLRKELAKLEAEDAKKAKKKAAKRK